MKRALILSLALAGCVSSEIPDSERADGVLAGEPPEEREITVDGRKLGVRQEMDWPIMRYTVGANGQAQTIQSGRGPTLLVFDATGFEQALKAVGQVCGVTSDPAAWDTQFVYRDPATGAYWFDGLCP